MPAYEIAQLNFGVIKGGDRFAGDGGIRRQT
jgi:hypothetical protein